MLKVNNDDRKKDIIIVTGNSQFKIVRGWWLVLMHDKKIDTGIAPAPLSTTVIIILIYFVYLDT